MATTTKKKTIKKSTTKPAVEEISNDIVETKVEPDEIKETIETKPKKEKKKFSPDDPIPCRSITIGGLYMEGLKSHISYEWTNDGDITEVEYQDLLAAVRSFDNYISKPRFIIEDEDFLEQNPRVLKVYDEMYTTSDLREIFRLEIPEMVDAISRMPEGTISTMKSMASSLISKGLIDSVSKINALDEIFGTKLILMTGLY